jgi:heme/copper-type cytochrome/quinol oxidase subunit 2
MNAKLLIVGMLFLFSVMIAACETQEAAVNDPEPFTTTVEERAEVLTEEINVRVSDSGYVPEEIKVKAGTELTIFLTSTTPDVDLFIIEEYDIEEQIVEGTKTIIRFTADKAGEFDFGDPTNTNVRQGKLVVN